MNNVNVWHWLLLVNLMVSLYLMVLFIIGEVETFLQGKKLLELHRDLAQPHIKEKK